MLGPATANVFITFNNHGHIYTIIILTPDSIYYIYIPCVGCNSTRFYWVLSFLSDVYYRV